ncbi:MAG: hypothetical protein R3F03_03145 [Opitutaceae bacterium]
MIVLSPDLCWAWNHAPYDRGGWWFAGAWLLVLAWGTGWRGRPQIFWLMLAVGLGLISVLGQINAARHAGIVFAGIAWVRGWKAKVVVGLAGFAWFPALGWLAARFVDESVMPWLRFGLLGGAAVTLWRLRQPRPRPMGRTG